MTTLVSIQQGMLERHLHLIGVNYIRVPLPKVTKWKSLPKDINNFIQELSKIKPDVFFVLKNEHITPNVFQGIKRVSPRTKIIMWYGDQRGDRVVPLISARAKYLDSILITNKSQKQIGLYHQVGIKHVGTFYHSFCPEEFKEWECDVDKEVFFGGSNFNSNKFPLSKLRKEFIVRVNRKFNLVVYGGKWPFHSKPWVMRDQYAKVLRRASINLGINHYDVYSYYNRRLFESVASGRLHITYRINGMEKHFLPGKHLITFNTVEDGLQKIKYYLNHPGKREEIAKMGRAHALEYHSWPVRIKQFKKVLSNVL